MKKFYIDTFNEGGCYLIPTICIIPNLSIWDDHNHTWYKKYRCLTVELNFLKFSLTFNFNYKVKGNKK